VDALDPMPLQLIRSAASEPLWEDCVGHFLDESGGHIGPTGYESHLWVVHRAQRDRLYERAARRGLPGWFNPPVSFFSQLRDSFGISERPIGILTGRLLVARLATASARHHRVAAATREAGPARGHMLDRLFSELLPEGTTPDELAGALAGLETDGFGERRNAWVVDTYRAFLQALDERERYDPRSIHAIVAGRIEAGGLRSAIGGARRLHVYGLTSLRGRRRLVRALASQDEVEVLVYLPTEVGDSEWDLLANRPPRLVSGSESDQTVRVQPAPDAVRETRWIARQIKTLLAAGDVALHEVAVVARTGRQDTRRLHRALREAGVPSTARIRTRLAEIPALRAILELFRAASEGWTYRGVRQVLASPYFDVDIDLRGIDHLSTIRRIHGLDEWHRWLERLRERAEANERRALARVGVTSARLEHDLSRFERLRTVLGALEGEHTELQWIDRTLAILRGDGLDLRRRLCHAVGDRWDIVRLDQRGALALEGLLVEWGEWPGVRASRTAFPAGEWYARLRRLLEANELALSTPLQQGVQILEAHEAASTPFRHTFLAHANDGVFPHPLATAGVFTEQERMALKTLGLPLTTRVEALEREHRLWRAIVSGPDITITYRTTDASGVPRLPSPLVPDHDPGSEIPRTRMEVTPRGDDAEDPGELAVSRPELTQGDVARFGRIRRGGDRSAFHTPDPHRVGHAVLTAFADELRSGHLDPFIDTEGELFGEAPIAAERGGTEEEPPTVDSSAAAALFGVRRPLSEQPTAWNGKIRDPWVLAYIREHFGEDRQWSATQLEAYGRRPFDFFLDRVLGLGDMEEADEETSPLTYGSIAHAILQRFFESLETPHPTSFDPRAHRHLDRAFEAICGAYEHAEGEWLGVPHVWRAKRAELRDRLERFLTWELEKARGSPIALELAFGLGKDRPAVDLSGADRCGAHQHLILGGRIDRVDRTGEAEDAPLRIIDYKSGSYVPTAGAYKDGAGLQTALYMAAVQELGIGSAAEGVYRSLKNRRNQSKLKASGVEAILRFARSIPARIRGGLFEAVQARSTAIAPWQPGPDLTRSTAHVTGGTRFDAVPGSVESSVSDEPVRGEVD
jgi:RecB family exonuclease